ncbi:glycoside hydrolase family 6 protein [Cnuibacter physcomitrellae]|uniref:glycoside hydrolase family 6 protein n=1 Tax=Cnuibacter physcomitrellae TaxID=1619308 RepID=UPI00217596BA|nr:glycoside hydrolase family 6 protein [Cnuibacter physcomitrellae]MCS5496072.1 glycoside hydrolase family 6 protein [Cnuibacter physcomitrellae]
MSSPASRVGVAAAIVALFVPVVASVLVVLSVLGQGGVAPDNPFAGKPLFSDPGSKAATAANAARVSGDEADADTFGKIAAVPTAVWLVPEKHPIGKVGPYVSDIVSQAENMGQMPVFVVYGIPNRDCGNFSGGGLTPEEYPEWVSEIASSLAGKSSVVILEPDALALAHECANVDERLGEINASVDTLVPSGATIYIDAGHSNWGPAADMADLLNRAGVAKVRGFSTNVSNYNTTDREIDYASTISGLTGGAHFVIDTGRNGNGSNGEWCNPSGRALGATPTPAQSGSAQDADLWIKPPGESDGTCNGGPAAGEWWDKGARELATGAGW